MASLGNLIERLARPPEDVRAENLRSWASSIAGTQPIADVQPRKAAKVAGVVQNLRIDPRPGFGSIEATLIDGTGQMVAKWLRRRSLQGMTLGVGLVVEGIPGVGDDGELVVLNPTYDLVPAPEHG